jgi:hypothetical protein
MKYLLMKVLLTYHVFILCTLKAIATTGAAKIKATFKKYYCKHQGSLVFKCPCWGLHEVGLHITRIFTKLTSAQRLYVETHNKFHLYVMKS